MADLAGAHPPLSGSASCRRRAWDTEAARLVGFPPRRALGRAEQPHARGADAVVRRLPEPSSWPRPEDDQRCCRRRTPDGLPGPRPTTLAEFRDGTAQTVLIVETRFTAIPWTEPRDLDWDRIGFQVDDPLDP